MEKKLLLIQKSKIWKFAAENRSIINQLGMQQKWLRHNQ